MSDLFYHSDPEYRARMDAAKLADGEAMTESELANVKTTLHHFAKVCCWTRGDPQDEASWRRHLECQGVLPSVIAWVLS